MSAVTPAGRNRLVAQTRRNANRRNQEHRNAAAHHVNVLRRSEEARTREAAEQAARNAAINRERVRYERNAAEAERTYPTYVQNKLAWNANEERKKRENASEQADENRQPRLVRANVEREAAALPNAGRADSDVPKLKTELETLPMLFDDYLKKLNNRTKMGRLSDATESEKSVAKDARKMQLGKKLTPLFRKPRNIPYTEEQFREERRFMKDKMGDRYEYEQKLFAEPGGGPIRIDPTYPHEVFMEMEDGTARYFESGYPKNKKPNPYPFTPTRLRREDVPIQPGLASGGSRKKKRSARSKKNRKH